jgi:hypothetical protein
VRFRLADRGEGWFWDRPAVEAEVTAQGWGHSRLYYLVRLEAPAVRHDPAFEEPAPGAAPAPPDSGAAAAPAAYAAAWVSARWIGHEIGPEEDITALLWLTTPDGELEPPAGDSPFSARVTCRRVE